MEGIQSARKLLSFHRSLMRNATYMFTLLSGYERLFIIKYVRLCAVTEQRDVTNNNHANLVKQITFALKI